MNQLVIATATFRRRYTLIVSRIMSRCGLLPDILSKCLFQMDTDLPGAASGAIKKTFSDSRNSAVARQGGSIKTGIPGAAFG